MWVVVGVGVGVGVGAGAGVGVSVVVGVGVCPRAYARVGLSEYVCVAKLNTQHPTSQVVSPGSATYLYDVCLRADHVDYREARPYAAITSSTSGSVCGSMCWGSVWG